MALRNFSCPSVTQRNVRGNVKNSISGRLIRNEIHKTRSPDTLPALREWNIHLSRNNIDWNQTLTYLFNGITNNYKLIQFQYKLLMRISTCKYMRYKMRIAKDNVNPTVNYINFTAERFTTVNCINFTAYVGAAYCTHLRSGVP